MKRNQLKKVNRKGEKDNKMNKNMLYNMQVKHQ